MFSVALLNYFPTCLSQFKNVILSEETAGGTPHLKLNLPQLTESAFSNLC